MKLIDRLKLKVRIWLANRQARKTSKLEWKASVRYYPKNNDLDILLIAHALEKGMGMQTIRKGFGQEKATTLCSLLENDYLDQNTSGYIYQEGLAVLWAYIRFQEAEGVDVSDIREKAQQLGASSINNAGSVLLQKSELFKNQYTDFESFVLSKHSVRVMSKDPVSTVEMNSAIRLASRAPSACNRQPSKVYYSLNKDQNVSIADMVPGNKGFAEDIPYYCVVTADRNLFRGGEMFQWYVNGGVFLGFFVLALHSLGIGSCVFQWPQFNDDDSRLRRLIHAGENEAIIAIVGYGKYAAESKCICAERKPIDEIGVKF